MNTRRGITLVELLVVIAIIGALVALLLPAVQAARESARLVQCKNHLRQVALATLHHENTHRAFPTGGWSSSWVGDPNCGAGPRQPGGWIYQLLRYLEEQASYDGGLGLTGEALQDALTKQARVPIAALHCPSRRPAQLYGIVALRTINYHPVEHAAKSDYAANGGREVRLTGKGTGPWPQIPFVSSDCLQGYPNCNWLNYQTWIDEQWNGIVGDHTGARLTQITDGASKTFLAGEKWLYVEYYETVSVDSAHDNATNKRAHDNPGDDGPMIAGYDLDTIRACGGGKKSDGSPRDYRPRRDVEYNLPSPQTDKKGAHYKESFGGPHPGGVVMARCDGSVDTWAFDVDTDVWVALGGRDDGDR